MSFLSNLFINRGQYYPCCTGFHHLAKCFWGKPWPKMGKVEKCLAQTSVFGKLAPPE
ncbi:hypothetical protein FORC22_3475 [Vibrio parahaemolyticus]|nr:hypothetical protein VPUCM_21201 [Vibrio parahaemolyticus UCM-V493]APC89336.1 hypothetical protein FORC22_3475 [Vibrio parahaemolyticus]